MKQHLLVAAIVLCALPVASQTAVPSAGATPFRDTSMLKPPTGSKLAIIEFEDLECYACAQASPLVRGAMEHYGIPRVHHDFLIPGHVWSRDAAIRARYLEDKISRRAAEDFRRDVFANQSQIASPEDLVQFAGAWFRARGLGMPFLVDPTGRCAEEVEADCALGVRLGLRHTPTIVIATEKSWIEVTDPRELNQAIDRAKASLAAPGPPSVTKRK